MTHRKLKFVQFEFLVNLIFVKNVGLKPRIQRKTFNHCMRNPPIHPFFGAIGKTMGLIYTLQTKQ